MPKFEDSLKQLETIVTQLEKGDLPLEDSIKLFEEGIHLSAVCKEELDAAEGKVQVLLKQRDGSLKAEPFHPRSSCCASGLESLRSAEVQPVPLRAPHLGPSGFMKHLRRRCGR